MKRNKIYLLVILTSMVLFSCTDKSTEKAPPQITAQGFKIDEIQAGPVGHFGSLKLRIESVGHIKHLYIKERSYEVDLATTPERNHFALFGIEKRALLRTDVTLDFQNYINQKLNQPGQYVFIIDVADKKGQTVKTTLTVHLVKPKDETTPIESGYFQMQREGKGVVAGGEKFGVTWKSIDEYKVTIRLSKAKNGASKLARFSVHDYEQLSSKEELSKKINAAADIDNVEFDTANNAAANQVLGIWNLGKYYMLKAEQSHTSLSYVGTTVNLVGGYKF